VPLRERFRAVPLGDGWVVRDLKHEYEDSQPLSKEDAQTAASQENEDEQEVLNADEEIKQLNLAIRNFKWHQYHATSQPAANFWNRKAVQAQERLRDLIYS
jgi:hypothetical protein